MVVFQPDSRSELSNPPCSWVRCDLVARAYRLESVMSFEWFPRTYVQMFKVPTGCAGLWDFGAWKPSSRGHLSLSARHPISFPNPEVPKTTTPSCELEQLNIY